MNNALLSSSRDDWETPLDIFSDLNSEFNFSLDAAASAENAKCVNFFSIYDDALSRDWGKFGGAVFCNPPYGRKIGDFVKKARCEAEKGTTVVMLIPARTDTRWFHDYIYGYAEIRFLKGRIKFVDPETKKQLNPAPFPSMVCVFKKGDE